MSDIRAKQKLAGLFVDANEVDVKNATLDPTLSKVWSDDTTGELAVSADRVLFDSLLDVAARYLEPHGFSLNLENMLAIVDSMRFSVFAHLSSKPSSDGRANAKRLMPSLFMHLPRKKTVGPLLQRFYDEIGRYESELARLQDVESKSKKAMDAAIRDESGRKTVELLRNENAALREELSKLGKKLAMAEDAIRAVPNVSGDQQLPVGIRSCVVRSVRPAEGVIMLKAGDNQYTYPLKSVGGIPIINARALSFHEGGVLKSVWVFDPKIEPFNTLLADVIAVDGRRAKLRFADRREQVVANSDGESNLKIGMRVVAKFANGYLINLLSIGAGEISIVSDIIFDQQTKRQLEDVFSGGAYD